MQPYHDFVLKTTASLRFTTSLHRSIFQAVNSRLISAGNYGGSGDLTPSSRTRNHKEPPPSIRLSWITHDIESKSPPNLLLDLKKQRIQTHAKEKRNDLSQSHSGDRRENVVRLRSGERREGLSLERLSLLKSASFENSMITAEKTSNLILNFQI